MKLEFQEILSKRIVNTHKHVDGPWFWTKYSAHPYIGCRSGCEFCYLRGGQYLGKRDPESFDTLIQVKKNSVELLRRELSKLAPDVINAGDWQQPAEDRYRLSRSMLKVVRDIDFPLFVVERSPLLLRDVDLLQDIADRSWVSVVFSISNLNQGLKQTFEPRSPGVKRRLQAIRSLADASILVGVSLMPIIPFLGDSDHLLDEVIGVAKDHGAEFVIGGGMTMSGIQADRTIQVVKEHEPASEAQWRKLYNWDTNAKTSSGAQASYTRGLGLRVRELAERHGIPDRMPRYIPKGSLGLNKRIAELLFLKTYDLELEGAISQRIWAYRKAAWTVDELETSVADIYGSQGIPGLQALPTIGQRLANLIASWLKSKEKIFTD